MFLGSNSQKKPTELSIEFSMLGLIWEQALGAVPGTDKPGLCGLRQEMQVGNVLCVTSTARK